MISSVCDLQEKFRNAIWEFDKVYASVQPSKFPHSNSPFPSRRVLTAKKVLRAAEALNIPIYATTQNRSRLGETVAELTPYLKSAREHADKTAFSMYVPDIARHFPRPSRPNADADMTAPPAEVAIVGIESHICVTQTALDLLAAGHRVYILADGVSSCNKEEVPIALARLRAEGAVVTTSESWLYECMGDAAIPEFRSIVGLVKETGSDTKTSLQGLLARM
jgi:hypothetical protein